ncbi:HNH endonuclease signature motif containing protein [Kitasatospora griseola]|uniref:HNH endonuclease signature motif containing protein n=1 Tax=Kitasatospora griseola TaxID=2064 RepID=UPI00381288BF
MPHTAEFARAVKSTASARQWLKNALKQREKAGALLARHQAVLQRTAQEYAEAKKERETSLKAVVDPEQRRRATARMFRDKHGLRRNGDGGGDGQEGSPETGVGHLSNRPDGRVCPVCDAGGLLPGQVRHKRCEGTTRSDAGGARPDSVGSIVRQRVGRREASPGGSSRYRDLVALVEERETSAYGRRTAGAARPVRLRQAREAVLLRCEGKCENPGCGGQPDDVTDAGLPLLEVDHIEEIGAGGRDHPESMAALCPNCHAIKSRGRGRDVLRAVLAEVSTRKHKTWMEDGRS